MLGGRVTRALWLATLGILGVLVAANVVSEAQLLAIDRAAQTLAAEVTPRIECLAHSRSALYELTRTVRGPRPPEEAETRRRLASLLRRCGVAERAASAEAMVSTRTLLAAADEALERAVDAEALRATDVGRAISGQRRHARRTAEAVHCLAMLVVLLAIGLVWLETRARAALEARELRAATERAQELELFAARVAHDLRAPLSAVLFYLRACDDRPPAAAERDVIEDTVAGAIDVVDALLDYARAAGQPARDAATDVGEIVAHVLGTLTSTPRLVNVPIGIDVDGALTVACARGGVVSIVHNLLRNALQHAVPAGAQHVWLRSQRRERQIRIEVSDDGPGVPVELRHCLFDPYVRGAARRRSGLGLGLATVRRLAEGCGGAAGFAPRPGGGSCFWVALPASSSAGQAHPRDDEGEDVAADLETDPVRG